MSTAQLGFCTPLTSHAALCNERYANFLLGDGVVDRDEARYRIKEATRYYQEWGAEAKVQMLENDARWIEYD